MPRWIDSPDWSDPTADTLVNALADAYPDPADARDLWRKIGMPHRDFPLRWNNARQLWAVAAQQIHLAGRLEKLITTAKEEWRGLRGPLNGVLAAAAQPAASSTYLLELTFVQETQLRSILNGATGTESVTEIYHDVMRGVSNPPPYPGDLWLAVHALRGAISAVPLCEFLARLASGPDKVTRDRLWKWLSQATPQWSVDMKDLQQRSRLLKRTVLSVRMEPSPLGPDLHGAVWIYSGTEGWQAAASGSEPWCLADVADQLGILLREIESVRGGEPIIEFNLPPALLAAPVERLVVDFPGGAQEIGALCPVVVRPLRRPASARHIEKWKALRQSANRQDGGTVQLITAEAANADELRDALCVGIIQTRDTPPDVLHAALAATFEAGVPAVLWHRASSYRYSNAVPLNEIIRDRVAQELQDIVFEQRRAAVSRHAPIDHPGRDVVLLWDNPHRVLPETTWRPPDEPPS